MNAATKSTAQSEQSIPQQNQTQAQPIKFNQELDAIIFATSANDLGIAYLKFENVNCNGAYLAAKKTEIMDVILKAAVMARGLLHKESYKPQLKPIMWFLSDIDFGVMVDAVAVSEADLLERADEIVAKLSRDCDLFIGQGGAK